MEDPTIKAALMARKCLACISDDDTLFKIYTNLDKSLQDKLYEIIKPQVSDFYHYKDWKYFSEDAQDLVLYELYDLVDNETFYKMVVPYINHAWYLKCVSEEK